jgi:hypothetical protein
MFVISDMKYMYRFIQHIIKQNDAFIVHDLLIVDQNEQSHANFINACHFKSRYNPLYIMSDLICQYLDVLVSANDEH